jgi:hypothetical protein
MGSAIKVWRNIGRSVAVNSETSTHVVTSLLSAAMASDSGAKSSKLSPSGPSAGTLCLRYIRLAPLGARIVAAVCVSAITGRPRNNQIKPVWS